MEGIIFYYWYHHNKILFYLGVQYVTVIDMFSFRGHYIALKVLHQQSA